MCGFVGYLGSNSAFAIDLEQWGKLIGHRGPDQHGSVTNGEFGLGTRRLSIVDLSDAGSQPMESGRYILGFNGEIYNHMDVRRELLAEQDIQFRSTSDTETVLLAIERWGVQDALSRLNGIFALAVWDKVRHELSLARDPLGVKPVFYMETDDAVLFGSEIRALRPHAPGKVSADAVAMYLYFGFVPAPYSLLEGACKVRAGEVVTFSRSGRESSQIAPRFWATGQPVPATYQEKMLRLREEVAAAVRRQLMSDVPLGIFLSGGIDSTIIASMAGIETQLTSFSLRPTGLNRDPMADMDADLAQTCAERLGFQHHEVQMSPEDVTNDILQVMLQIDEPVAELYAVGEVLLSRRARQEGVKVVLTGHGGDEVFMGYPTYGAVSRGDLHNRIPLLGPALRIASQSSLFSAGARDNFRGAASVWRQSPDHSYAIVSGVHFSIADVAELTGRPQAEISEMVHDVVASARAGVQRLPQIDDMTSADRHARMDLMLMVADHYNNRLDRASMGASVEARVPFQDLELLGYVMQLSQADLMHGGLKGMLKEAFSDVLPQRVTTRTKQTFQAPVLSWTSGALAPWIRDQLASTPMHLTGMNAPGRTQPVTTKDAYRQWSVALLEGWRNALALHY